MYPISIILVLELLFLGVPGKEDERALELITKFITGYGYPVEKHEIKTDDGYFLNLHRIPNGKSQFNKSNDNPVLLVHGMGGCAETFVWLGPSKSLGFVLADNGYDVWLLNVRGSWHSLKHKSLDPDKDDEYWKFSWHEIGIYDTPAAIDYILEITNKKSLHYIGHSQGTTTLFAMGSERESYNDKIKVMIALGPSSVNIKPKHDIVTLLLRHLEFLQLLARVLNINKFLPILSMSDLHTILHGLCGHTLNQLEFCKFVIFLFGGIDRQLDVKYPSEVLSPEFDTSGRRAGIICPVATAYARQKLIPLITLMAPGGFSANQMIHYGQNINNGKFEKFDFGEKENLEVYGLKKPPAYNITRSTFPVALFYGENDSFVSKEAIEILVTHLPNIVEMYKVPYKKWSHIDMIWGRDVNKLLNPRILEVMKKYV